MIKRVRERRAPEHYVNNREFSEAVMKYVRESNDARSRGEEPATISNYIGECFLKIAEGLSHKANYINYSYREEMVMDAVENCIKAIMNYDIEKATRTGNPNAFAYFTQISIYAFWRRIAKEKKQDDIRQLFIEQADVRDFMTESDNAGYSAQGAERGFVDILKKRIDKVHYKDAKIKAIKKERVGALDEFMPV